MELSEESLAMLKDLHDREKIRELMYRYARGVDRGDYELITSAFHPEGTDKHGHFDGPATQFAAGVVERGAAAIVPGNHHITNMTIELEGDCAFVETYFLAFHPHVDSGVRVGNGYLVRPLHRRARKA